MRKQKHAPYLVLAAVIAMYAAKAYAKITIGTNIHSPMIAGDGFHNAADLVEALLVLVAVCLSKLPASDRYPFGRKNVESIVRLAIGLTLLPTALHFGGTSLMGLLSRWPSLEQGLRGIVPFALPRPEPLLMGNDVLNVWWILGVTSVSVLLSVVVSAWEIRVGKAHGHVSLVADGEETRSDALIETVILLGVLFEYGFGATWLEYPLGIVVSGLVARTGVELAVGGWRALLQHSLGPDVEDAVLETCLKIRGVERPCRVTTFAVGSRAICILKVTTSAPPAAHEDLKEAIIARLRQTLAGLGHEDAGFYLRFSPPAPDDARVAFAAVTDDAGTISVVPTLSMATHVIVAETRRGHIPRWTLRPIPPPDQLWNWLELKRVTRLNLFGVGPVERHGNVTLGYVPSYGLETLGLKDPP